MRHVGIRANAAQELVRRLVAPVLVAMLLVVVGTACTGEEAVPIDPANPPTTLPDLTGITHLIEPTDQMRDAAEAQCFTDDRAEGYIEAVDASTGQVLSSITVDCAEVRAAAAEPDEG
jgi:hypothetical protein